jgi:hypothetical protein
MTYQAFDLLLESADEALLHEALSRAQEILTDDQRFYILHCIKARKDCQPDSIPALMQRLETFVQRSKKGYFYREFDMGGKNFNWVPPHTVAWFYELGLWLDKACELAQAQDKKTARKIFDICLPLIDDMCEGIVFAHEPGDWMIHTHYDYQAVYESLKNE